MWVYPVTANIFGREEPPQKNTDLKNMLISLFKRNYKLHY